MPIPLPSASIDAARSRLPLSGRAFPARTESGPVSWGGTLPALPAPVADAVTDTWGLTVARTASAPDPLDVPTFRAAFAQARADQVVRAFSRRTNLVLAGSTVAVVGDGPIADALTTVLTRMGSRVVRVADAPATRVRAHLAGLETAVVADLDAASASAHSVFATGEGHAPLDPSTFDALLADASVGGAALAPVEGPERRPHVHDAGRGVVVEIPTPFPAALDEGDGLAWRLADLLIALCLSAAATGGDLLAADGRLAREVLA